MKTARGNAHIIEVTDLTKVYVTGEVTVNALHGIDLAIDTGEFVAIMGASGSGKSTFMNILGCLDVPTTGSYILDGSATHSLEKDTLAAIRNKKIGFVFQGFNLLSRTSALDNVMLPLLYSTDFASGKNGKGAKDLAKAALARIGLGDRIEHFPNQLSGGQQQRVAIARALVNTPSLILADEPTGNLDTTTSEEIMSVFCELNDQGITVVLVTHESDIAQFAKRIIEFKDGKIISDKRVVKRKHHSAENAGPETDEKNRGER
jgi:putative ABC transport system ATP-binding protein